MVTTRVRIDVTTIAARAHQDHHGHDNFWTLSFFAINAENARQSRSGPTLEKTRLPVL